MNVGKIIASLLAVVVLFGITGCGRSRAAEMDSEINDNEAPQEVLADSYKSISMDEAKTIFETAGDYIIVDVRRADEFAEGHIPGAINIANESITDAMPKELPDKSATIYIYCRSGNRSKQASKKLVAIGYTNIIEFGGIMDWTGELEN